MPLARRATWDLPGLPPVHFYHFIGGGHFASLHASRANCADHQKAPKKMEPTLLGSLERSTPTSKSTSCIGHTRLVLCANIVRTDHVVYAAACTSQICSSKEKAGDVCHKTRCKATWSSERTLVVLCHQKASIRASFLSWSWKHLPGKMHDAEQRHRIIQKTMVKNRGGREVVLLLLVGRAFLAIGWARRAKVQANMSASQW